MRTESGSVRVIVGKPRSLDFPAVRTVHQTGKVCTGCGERRQVDEFAPRRQNSPDWLSDLCLWCERSIHLVSDRNRKRQARYGLSDTDYEHLHQAQDGKCGLCGEPPAGKKRLSPYQCKASGQVRGLLCHRCRMALSILGDDPARLRTAADYLERT